MAKFLSEISDNRILSEKVKDGEYMVELKKPRNYRFLKKYFKLIDFTLYHLPEIFEYSVSLFGVEIAKVPITSKDSLHGLFKYFMGVETISFAGMTEDEFSEFYSKALDICCRILGAKEEDVIRELVSFM